MKIIIFLCIIAIVILIYELVKNSKQSLLYTIFLSALIIYIILNPKASISYTIEGSKLFFYSVFPSLFPFLVIVNLIFAFGGIEIYSALLGNILCKPLRLPKECSVVLLASTFCGYPLGARYASQLYEMGKIDRQTFIRLLNIATNGSPLFIIGAVGTSMLHSPFLGYILIISNILSCLIMGIIIPVKKEKPSLSVSNKAITNIKIKDTNFGIIFKNALEDATKTCLSIGGFVVIFSVIINMIKSSNIFFTALSIICKNNLDLFNILNGFLLGFIEITNGCSIISLGNFSLHLKAILCSFLIGFSGLSITSQVYSFIYKYKVSIKRYLSLKFIQGVICSFITLGILKLPLSIWKKDVFLNTSNQVFSVTNHTLILIVILIAPVIIQKLIKSLNSRQAP